MVWKTSTGIEFAAAYSEDKIKKIKQTNIAQHLNKYIFESESGQHNCQLA